MTSKSSVGRRVAIAAAIGFAIPVLFALVAVVLVAPGHGAALVWIVTHVPYGLCPSLALTHSDSNWFYASPLVNAALYGVLCYLWLRVVRRQRVPA